MREIPAALLCPHKADSESAHSGAHVLQCLALWLSTLISPRVAPAGSISWMLMSFGIVVGGGGVVDC
jgi:hypothetical protein